MAGLAAAKRRGRRGGRPPAIDSEKLEQIVAALENGASKASVCRTFKIPRTTLIDTLQRVGWTAPAATPQAKSQAGA
jgi:DNA invertase Pin-like site-specific DNA recombinase